MVGDSLGTEGGKGQGRGVSLKTSHTRKLGEVPQGKGQPRGRRAEEGAQGRGFGISTAPQKSRGCSRGQGEGERW